MWLNQPTNSDLQCGDECWEFFSSEHSEEPQGRTSGDEKNIICIDAFEEGHVEMLWPFPPRSLWGRTLFAVTIPFLCGHDKQQFGIFKNGHPSSFPQTNMLGCGDIGACPYVFLKFPLWTRGGGVCLSSMREYGRGMWFRASLGLGGRKPLPCPAK